ncbi:hypothetical protein GCM10010349_18200 [Streptomyces flavofungini]|nr:hypothetical protein GCM10010349_18200 [Streptomyces flavofungini]
MGRKSRPDHGADQSPQTAADEVLSEAEEAETSLPGREREPRKDAEAGDALSPSPEAQKHVARNTRPANDE